jgi:hypothetical protein
MAALTRICEITAVVVAALWNKAEEPFRYPHREEPHEFWWPYRPYPRGGELRQVTPWLWNFQPLPNSTYLRFDGQLGVPCVTAGVASGERGLATLDASQIENLVNDGFAVLPVKQGTRSPNWDYVIRTWYPRDLDGPGDLNAQATRLAEKINEAFRAIDEILDRT